MKFEPKYHQNDPLENNYVTFSHFIHFCEAPNDLYDETNLVRRQSDSFKDISRNISCPRDRNS